MRTHRLAAIVATAGLALSLAACGSAGDSDDTTDANAAYCESSQALQTEVQELLTMVSGGSGTVDDLEEQRRQVRTAYGEALEDSEELAESVQDQVVDANENFEEAIRDIDSNATIAEATAAYNAAAAAYRDELNAIRTQLGC